MPETSPETLLETCPRCDYSLHTMPVECRCPECGTQLDRSWRIVAPIQNSRAVLGWRALTTLACAILPCKFALDILSGWGRQSGWAMLPAAFWLIMTLILCYTAWRWLFARPTGFLASSPKGLVVSLAPEARGLYPWGQIKGVVPDRWGRGVILKLEGGKARLSGRMFFRGTQDMARCIETIRAHRRSLSNHEQTS